MHKYISAAIVLLVIAVGVIIYLVVRSTPSKNKPTPSKNNPTPSKKNDSSMADDLLAQMSAEAAVENPSVEVASAALIDACNKLKMINTYADRISNLYTAAKASGVNLAAATDAYNHAGKLVGGANGYMTIFRANLVAANKAAGVIAHLSSDITESVPGRLIFPSGSAQNTLQPNWDSCVGGACGEMPDVLALYSLDQS